VKLITEESFIDGPIWFDPYTACDSKNDAVTYSQPNGWTGLPAWDGSAPKILLEIL
jgi:hypothetical protein